MTYALALGIDLGTSGVRAAAVRPGGRIVAMAKSPHLPQPNDDIDARLWWQAVVTCVNKLGESLNLQEIDAVAIDGTSGTLVLVDESLEPVTPALMYNSKGFEAEAERISAFAPDPHVTQGSNSALARALYLHYLDADGRGKHLLHQADYILARFAMQNLGSDSNNALKTGCDPETCDWPDWIAETGLPPGLLPCVAPPGTNVGYIAPEVANSLGLRPDLALHLGTTDSIAAHMATGALSLGDAVTSLGTTMVLKVVSEQRIDAPNYGLYSHRLGNFWLVGGASNTGGGVLLHYFTPTELEKLSQQIDPTQDTGLDYYPLIHPGERFPIPDPELTPRLTPQPNSPSEFLHGLFEGMARIEAQAYKRLVELGAQAPHKVLTVGGGAQNQTWQAIRRLHIGVPVEKSETSEACIGVANLCFS